MPTFKTIPILTKQIRFAGLFVFAVFGLSGFILAHLLQLQVYQSMSLMGWILGIAGLAWLLFFKPLWANIQKNQESAQLMEMIIQNAPDQIVCVRFPEGNMDIVNKTMCDMLGYSEEQLLAMRVFEVDMQFTEKSWDQMAAQMNEMRKKLEMGELLMFRTRHRTSDNRIIDVEIRVYKIEFHGVHYEVCFVRDITQDVQTAGDDFQTLLARQKALLNNIPYIAWMKDGHSRYVAVNDAYANFCKRKIEDIIGKTSFDIWPKEIAERYQAYEQSMIEASSMDTSSKLHIEEELRDADGNQAWYEIFQTPIFDPSNFIIRGVVGIAQNISRRKADEETIKNAKLRLEQELQERKLLESQLIQAQKMESLGHLAAGIAHEINNPMAFVQSNLSSMRDYLDVFKASIRLQMALQTQLPEEVFNETPEMREDMDILKKQDLVFLFEDTDALMMETKDGLNRITEIVQGLKSFARPDEIILQEADINECLESTLKIAGNELKHSSCTVEKILHPLPPLKCYPGQLNQVFLNILVNAAQASAEQGIIRIETACENDEIIVKISDTGSGIAPEDVQNIFNPFFTTKPVGKGTGLGLSISYGIIQKHGGTILVESELGKGSTFTIKLPLYAAGSH